MNGRRAWLLVLLALPPGLAAGVPEPSPSPSPQFNLAPFKERLRRPLGTPRAMLRVPPDEQLLHFEDRVDVVARPLDLVRLRIEWTRHWNLSGQEPAPFGPPTHSNMRERWQYLSTLSGHPLPQGLPLLSLIAATGRALTERLTRKSMPPAGPPLPAGERPAPLEVLVEESQTEPSGVSSAAQGEPTPSASPEEPEITRIVGRQRAPE